METNTTHEELYRAEFETVYDGDLTRGSDGIYSSLETHIAYVWFKAGWNRRTPPAEQPITGFTCIGVIDANSDIYPESPEPGTQIFVRTSEPAAEGMTDDLSAEIQDILESVENGKVLVKHAHAAIMRTIKSAHLASKREAVADDVYDYIAAEIAPYVFSEPNPKSSLPASVAESFDFLLQFWLDHRANPPANQGAEPTGHHQLFPTTGTSEVLHWPDLDEPENTTWNGDDC